MLENSIPKIFWKYYDLYRRKVLSINDFAVQTGLPVEALRRILIEISETTVYKCISLLER